jgi:uncharacterized protein (TIGR02246 family)
MKTFNGAASTPEEIHALIAEAMTTGDLDAFIALHEPTATTVVPPAGEIVTGVEAIRTALRPMFDSAPNAAIQVTGKIETAELALTHAHWVVSGNDGLSMSGRGTIVSRRQPDGTWRIVIDNPLTPE